MQPFTFGSMIWDQAEADIGCHRTSVYACLQTQLVDS